jgi:hypothetical protein
VKYVYVLILVLSVFSCNATSDTLLQQNRIFTTSFEDTNDFSNFYIVPQGSYDSYHELTTDKVLNGNYAHKAWIIKARANTNDGIVYLPHRAYPTIQLYKTEMGSFVTPCLVTIYVNLSIILNDKPSGQIDDWFSFATLSPDKSDNWTRTVLVNITPDNLVRLVHVPNQGEQQYVYQNESVLFPYNEWVRLDIYIDFSRNNGYAKVWQNRILVSYANVSGGNGILEQAHFGLYSSAATASGVIYNDELCIREIPNEEAALQLME